MCINQTSNLRCLVMAVRVVCSKSQNDLDVSLYHLFEKALKLNFPPPSKTALQLVVLKATVQLLCSRRMSLLLALHSHPPNPSQFVRCMNQGCMYIMPRAEESALALQASASAQPCITLPAGDYGPTGSINYATGPNRAPTPDCTVGSGIVCSIYIPISNGTAKICASQTAEDALRG